MKRKTVYWLRVDRTSREYNAVAARGYVYRHTAGEYSFDVCYIATGRVWKSVVGGIMCTTGDSLAACKDRTSAAIAGFMLSRRRLVELLALPMVLNDVLENGGTVSFKQYDALRDKYMHIAEGMLDA